MIFLYSTKRALPQNIPLEEKDQEKRKDKRGKKLI